MSASPSSSTGLSSRARIWIRLLVSPINLAIVLGVLWIQHRTGSPLATDIVLALLGAVGAWEMAVLLLKAGWPVQSLLAVAGAGALAGVGLFAPQSAALRMEVRVLLLTATFFAILLAHFRDVRREAVDGIASTLLPVLFVGLLLSWTRELGAGDQGAAMLVWVVVTAKASDIGGWVVGKPFGRHKLIPSVSPGKSWEGLAGGLLASVLAAVFLAPLLDVPPAEWSVVRRALFGVAVGGASVVAGIFWSAWKRRLDAKDSSGLLPEIGGVLDLIDSMLVAGPVAWAWLRLGL